MGDRAAGEDASDFSGRKRVNPNSCEGALEVPGLQ